MTIFTSLASLLGYALAMRYHAGRHFCILIFVATCAAGCLLYLFALAGILSFAAWLLLLGGFLAGGWTLGLVIRRRQLKQLRFVVSPGPVVLVLACALYSGYTHGRFYASSDEYANWGRLTKYLMLSEQLPDSEKGSIVLPAYAPGAGLFQYFMQHPGEYSEGGTYLAHFFLLMAGLTVLWDGIPWNRAHWGFLALLVSVGLMLLLGGRLDLLLVEGVLMVHLTALLLMSLRMRLDRTALLWFVPPLFFLPLVKDAGVFPALTAAAAALSQFLIGRYLEPMPPCGRRSRPHSAWLIAALLLVAGSPVAARQSWIAHCRALGFERTLGITNISLTDISQAFSERAENVHKEAIETFFARGLTGVPLNKIMPPRSVMDWLRKKNLQALPVLLQLDMRSWFLLLGALGIFCISLFSERRYRWGIASSLLWILGFSILYLCALLLAYLFRLGEVLISFERYVSVYVGATAIFLVNCLLVRLRDAGSGPNGRRSILARQILATSGCAVIVAALFFLIWDHTSFKSLLRRGPKPGARLELDQQAAYIQTIVEPTDRTYLISQGQDYYRDLLSFQILGYDMTPWPSNHRHFQPGMRSRKAPGFNTPEEWASILVEEGYDYVYLIHVDGSFRQKYASLFATDTIASDALFRVFTDDDRTVELRPVR